MLNRIIEISEDKIYLNIENSNLCIEKSGDILSKIPSKEISILLLTNRQTILSQNVLSNLAENNCIIISCNEKYIPVSYSFPIIGNHLQTERLSKQINISKEQKDKIWKRIISLKIKTQSNNLLHFYGDDKGLLEMSKRVLDGDSLNIESLSAARYWKNIFNDENFIRDREKDGINAQLNYGYSIIRAIMTRAICSSGLCPSLGVHHCNRFDSFCLSDDLMEPLRFLIDYFIIKYNKNNEQKIDKNFKKQLLEFILQKFEINNEKRSLFDISLKYSQNIISLSNKEKYEFQEIIL